MVDPFDTTVSAGVVSTRGDFAHTQEFVDCGQKLGADLRVIIRKKGRWTTPEKEEAAIEKVSRSLRCEFRFGDGEHVGTAAKAVRE